MGHALPLFRVLVASIATLALIGLSSTATAQSTAVIDEASAAALCETSYPGVTGPDPLSPCQWDMPAINAAEAHEFATGAGVTVGVIDGGIDFTHPDLAGAIDVGLSCSFIFDDTPTADPSEIANGDCSNKAAVQDLQGHGTHVATTIAARENGFVLIGGCPNGDPIAIDVADEPGTVWYICHETMHGRPVREVSVRVADGVAGLFESECPFDYFEARDRAAGADN